MKHWIDTYPHKVYASVLLLDNKIIDYKIGQNYWNSPLEVSMSIIDLDKLKRMTTEYTYFTVENSKDHNLIFTKHARDWFKNWDIHDECRGTMPYEKIR